MATDTRDIAGTEEVMVMLVTLRKVQTISTCTMAEDGWMDRHVLPLIDTSPTA